MTPLRQRFIQDLQLRNRSPKTISVYVMHVRHFAEFFHQSPDQLTGEQVHRYLLHLLHEKKASWPQYNQAVRALRFLYTVTCPSDTVVTRLPYGRRPRRLPQVRSREEVARLLAGVHSPVAGVCNRPFPFWRRPTILWQQAGGRGYNSPKRRRQLGRRQVGGLGIRFRWAARYPAAEWKRWPRVASLPAAG